MQERSLRDNSSLVTVTRKDLYFRQFVSISIIMYHKSRFFFFKFQQERSYGEEQYGAGGVVKYFLILSIFELCKGL